MQPRPMSRRTLKRVGLYLLVSLLGTAPEKWLPMALAFAMAVDLVILYRGFSGSARTMLFVDFVCASLGVAASFLADLLTVVVYEGTLPGSGSAEAFARLIIFGALDVLLTDFFVILRKSRNASLRKRGNYVLIACACLEILTVTAFMLHMLSSARGLTVPAIIGVAIVCCSYFALSYLYARYMKKCIVREERAEAIAVELGRQEELFSSVAGELADLRRLRHDYKNHMTIVRAMVQAGRKDEALAYLSDFQEKLEKAGEKPELEARGFGRFIGSQAALLSDRGISLSFAGEPPREESEGRYQEAIGRVIALASSALRGKESAQISMRVDDKTLALCMSPLEAAAARSIETETRASLSQTAVVRSFGEYPRYTLEISAAEPGAPDATRTA